MGTSLVLTAPAVGRKRRLWKRRHVVATFHWTHLADPLPLHLVDPHHGMQGNEGAFHSGEFVLQPLLSWIDQHARTFAKDQFLDFNKAVQIPLIDFPGIEFVQLALIDEQDAVNALGDFGR